MNVEEHSLSASLLSGKASTLVQEVVDVDTASPQSASAEDAEELLLPGHPVVVLFVCSARRGLIGVDIVLDVVGGVVAKLGCEDVG